MSVHQKLGMILESKMVQKCFYQKIVSSIDILKWFFFEKIHLIVDIENWLWKKNFVTFGQLPITNILKIQYAPLGMLIFRQTYFVPPDWKLNSPYCHNEQCNRELIPCIISNFVCSAYPAQIMFESFKPFCTARHCSNKNLTF